MLNLSFISGGKSLLQPTAHSWKCARLTYTSPKSYSRSVSVSERWLKALWCAITLPSRIW
jgi:hypothetical protein